jgi:hypothetical protein
MNIKIKSKKVVYLLIVIFSIALIVYCLGELIDCMIMYKYHFEDNFDDVDRTISYDSRKIELEIILNYLKVFMIYLFIITVYFLYRNKKHREKFYLITAIVSMLIFVFCALELFNYIKEYRHCITTNSNHSDLVYAYKLLKKENAIIMSYLKIFIVYLITITSYFMYRLFSKKNNPTNLCFGQTENI